MTTNRTSDIQVMLNDYMPNKLLSDELVKRDYILNRVTKDFKCKGISNSVNATHNSKIVVPFKSHGATSLKVNGLTAAGNVGKAGRVRGYIDHLTEFWGTLKLLQGDILDTEGKIIESSFVNAVTDEVEDFSQFMKEQVSIQIGTGPHLCTIVSAANSDFVIDDISRLQLNQQVEYVKDATPDVVASLWVNSISIDGRSCQFRTTMAAGGSETVANIAVLAGVQKFFLPGILTDAADGTVDTITSFRMALLSAANGGATNLHGKAKTAYPFLQCLNIDGTAGQRWTGAWTIANTLSRIFDGYVDVRKIGRGMADTVLLSWTHLANIMKSLELVKGAYKVTKDPVATIYGWTEIEIMSLGNGNNLKIVGLQEWDDDVIAYIDWNHITMRSNGGFRKRMGPNGNEYHEVREETGYYYLIDSFITMEMEFRKPSTCGIIHSITPAVA